MVAKRFGLGMVMICAALLLPRVALAHAMLVSSTPAANATVHAGDAAIELRFNSRVDGARSMLMLVKPDGSTEKLTLDKQHGATMLNAHAALKPGKYTIRWQALAPDGHITRGEIPFTVQ
jgi:methionine-rich copper-binding protein CopC